MYIAKLLNYFNDKYKINNLCLAGGVALNCKANGKIVSEKIPRNIFIPPVRGDVGVRLVLH